MKEQYYKKWAGMKKLYVLAAALVFVGTVNAQQVDFSKLSVMLGSMVKERYATIAETHRSPDTIDPVISALVKADAESVFSEYGATVIDRVDDLYFVVMTLSQMERLSQSSHIVRIEANEPNRIEMSQTPELVGATKLHSGIGLPQAYTGRGVLVGICDGGFDLTHPMFRNADGTTRIKWAWDAYTGRGATEGYRGVGSLYDTPEKLMAAKGFIDSVGYHGTHVASIAAGSPILNGKYRGIAYESDIVLFECLTDDNEIDPTDPNGTRTLGDNVERDLSSETGSQVKEEWKYYSTSPTYIAQFMGMKRFFDYAQEQGRPAVMNCSFGAPMSLYFDHSLEEEFLGKITGPGRIIVASAGNAGDMDYYRFKAANTTLEDSLIVYSNTSFLTFTTTNRDFKITLTLNNAEHTQLTFTADDFDESAYPKMHVTDVPGRWGNYRFGFDYGFHNKLSNGDEVWHLKLVTPTTRNIDFLNDKCGMAIKVEGSSEIRMHGNRSRLFFKKGWDAINSPYTLSTPGAFRDAIGVGLTCHRLNYINEKGKTYSNSETQNPLGLICSWSSAGPTLDGRMKPDVCAPGFNILAAGNSYLKQAERRKKSNYFIEHFDYDGRSYPIMGISGTSMAAPVVTGIVALWLQADPTLTPSRVKEVIAATAKHLDPALTYPNTVYGSGEIDAYAGLLKILNVTSVSNLSTHQADIALDGRTLRVKGADMANVTVYSLTGQVMLQTITTDGIVQLPQLPSGVYAVQVNADGRSLGSTLIRL